jgi:hypothetical protein
MAKMLRMVTNSFLFPLNRVLTYSQEEHDVATSIAKILSNNEE